MDLLAEAQGAGVASCSTTGLGILGQLPGLQGLFHWRDSDVISEAQTVTGQRRARPKRVGFSGAGQQPNNMVGEVVPADTSCDGRTIPSRVFRVPGGFFVEGGFLVESSTFGQDRGSSDDRSDR